MGKKLTDASSSETRVLGMELGRHPLAIDDELVPRTTNADLGNLLPLDGLLGRGEFDTAI